MKPMSQEAAYITLVVVGGITFTVIAGWAFADQVGRAAYWVRRIQGSIVVIGVISILIWATISLIIGGAQ